jgi:hypothetical protein
VKRRPPIDTGGGRATGETDLQIARQIIEKSGVLPVLSPLLEKGIGRPRTLPLEAFLVAAQLNALHRHHQAHLIEIARILNAMTPEQRASLGIGEWDPAEAYGRVERLFVSLCRVLEERPVVDGVEIDAEWFANRIMAAAIPAKFKTSSSVAVDRRRDLGCAAWRLHHRGTRRGGRRDAAYGGKSDEASGSQEGEGTRHWAGWS